MFGCCCANKKALKNKELKNGEQKNGETKAVEETKNDNNNSSKSPQKNASATDATVAVIVSPKSPLSNSSRSEVTSRNGININDKSSGSEEGNNNLGGLIMSDGLVEEINLQLKNRLDLERSNDTTESSNITVIEGHGPEEGDIVVVVEDEVCDKNSNVECEERKVESDSDETRAKLQQRANDYGDSNSNNNNNNNDATTFNFPPLSTTNAGGLPSCLLRRDSSRASVKKKVRCSETAEIIPASDYFINNSDVLLNNNNEDDEDEVFSDSAPAQVPRGNMCTPYVPRKGSLPISEALPDWFPNPSEGCGTPPTTPLTPLDELALKRHRFFTNLLEAANSAITNNQIRYDQLETFEFSLLSSAGVIVNSENEDHRQSCSSTMTTNTAICNGVTPGESKELVSLIGRLESIVSRLEQNLPPQLCDSITSPIHRKVSSSYSQTDLTSPDERFLPTVLPHLEKRLERIEQEQRRSREFSESTTITQTSPQEPKAMSVNAYEDIILGPFAQFLELSAKIGDDVATQADFVKKAFDAQLQYVTMASQSAAPQPSEISNLLKPTSDQIMAIQSFREKHRTSKFFNHLSAISESIPALGWVCIAPTPGPHVKEMNDAGQFYTNRVLKEWKEKDVTHVNWAKSWIQTLTDLQAYIKQYHTTGIVWAGKAKATLNGNSAGAPPPPPPGGLPPPPPMPVFDLSSAPNSGDGRNELFAQINKGADITKSLKKVTSDMQTHKNPNLREGPAPYKGPTPFKPAIAAKPGSVPTAPAEKPPVFSRDGKKWIIEHQKNNAGLLVENAEMNNVVYMFKSVGSTLTVKGKINSIIIDSCKKCSVVFDTLVSSVEFVNCQSVQMQVLGKVPTISIDKTDGCQMYLSKDSLNVEIISSKSSEMNVLIPTPAGDDYVEQPVPEQFKTVINGSTLHTSCNESLG